MISGRRQAGGMRQRGPIGVGPDGTAQAGTAQATPALQAPPRARGGTTLAPPKAPPVRNLSGSEHPHGWLYSPCSLQGR